MPEEAQEHYQDMLRADYLEAKCEQQHDYPND